MGVDQAGITGSNRAADGVEARQVGSNQFHRICNTFVLRASGDMEGLEHIQQRDSLGFRCRNKSSRSRAELTGKGKTQEFSRPEYWSG